MNIDSLSIQITSSSTQAEKAIDKLIDSLSKLDKAMNGFGGNTNGLDSLASALEKVGNVVSSLNPENIKSTSNAISTLAKSASTLNTIASGLKDDPFKNIATSLSSLENVSIPDFTNLTSFANTVNKLGYKSSSIATDNIRQITTGLRDLSSVQLPNLEGIGSVANEIAQFGYKNVQNAATAIPSIAEGLKHLSGVQAPNISGFQGIGQFAQEVGKFGSKSIQSAVEVMPRFAKAFNQMLTELSRAPRVGKNVTELANSLANLARELRSTNTASTGASKGLLTFGSSASRAQKSTKGLANTIGKIYASYFLLFRGLRQLGKATTYASDLVEVQNVIDQTFGDKRQVIEDFAKDSIRNFGMAELQAKQVASRFQAMGTAMGIPNEKIKEAGENLSNMGVFLNKNAKMYNANITSMADMSTELTKLTADMGSFFNMPYEDVAKDMESIFTGQTRPMRTYGIDLTQANLKQWALENGMNANLKTMTQWEKTLLRYQYVLAHTTAAQGDFLRTYNTWANVTRTIGQQFQQLGKIIGTGVINTFKPLLINFRNAMNTILDLAEKTLNALGKIFGWQIEISDVGIADDYADAMEDVADDYGAAAKNAKKLKDYTLGIDELNIINPNKGGSGGGGATGGAGSGAGAKGGMFDIKETEKFYESDLDTLYKLGDAIGQKLKETLSGIPWNDIYQGAKDFGKGLADFLNGLISPGLFWEFGKTLADSLNTAIYTALSFGLTFEWEEFGVSIGAGVNGFFTDFDFEALAETLKTWKDGLKKTIKGAVDTIEWKLVFSKLYDFFKALDIETVAIILGAIGFKAASGTIKQLALAGLAKAFGTINGMIALPIPEILLAVAIAKVVVDIIDTTEIDKKFNNWKKTGFFAPDDGGWTAFSQAMKKVQSGIALTDEQMRNLQETFGLGDASMEALKQTWLDNHDGLNQLIQDFPELSNVSMEELEKINGALVPVSLGFTSMKEAYQKAFESGEYSEDTLQFFETLATDIDSMNTALEDTHPTLDSIGDKFIGMQSTASTALTNMTNDMNLYSSSAGDALSGVITKFKKWWEDEASPWWDENVAPWFSAEKWSGIGQGLIEGISLKWDEFKDWWANTAIVQWWDEHVAPWFTTEKWSEVASGIKEGIDKKWTELVNWWNNTGFKKWWDGVTEKFSTKSWTFSGVVDGFKATFKNAVNGAIAIFNKFIDWINSKMKFSWDAINIAGKEIVPAGSVQLMNIPHIPTFAEGGYPESGSFFWAGENGVPELLGTVGGHTAVASGNEITGIKDSVEQSSEREIQVMERFIDVGERIIQAIEDKDFSIGDADIALANNRGQTLIGLPIVQ